MSRTRIPNPGADVTEEIRSRNYRAQLWLSVLCRGFSQELREVYSHENAASILEMMNEKLPPAIKGAQEAYEAYRPVRRRRRIHRQLVVQ